MSYKLTIDKRPGYLHAIVTGRNSRENVAGYLRDVVRECEAARCPHVLIEERLEGPRLNTVSVFQVASEGSSAPVGILNAIAYVDINAEGELMRFAETVAVNRGVTVKVFSTVAEAEEWLLEQGS